jgi:hypothetical protein
VMSFLFSQVRASEPLSASLTRSTAFRDVIPWPVATALGDHLTNLNRPLMTAGPAVPDITIDAAERPVGTTAPTPGQGCPRSTVTVPADVGSASVVLDRQRQRGWTAHPDQHIPDTPRRPASDVRCIPRPRLLVAAGVCVRSDACYSWLVLVRLVLVICTVA